MIIVYLPIIHFRLVFLVSWLIEPNSFIYIFTHGSMYIDWNRKPDFHEKDTFKCFSFLQAFLVEYFQDHSGQIIFLYLHRITLKVCKLKYIYYTDLMLKLIITHPIVKSVNHINTLAHNSRAKYIPYLYILRIEWMLQQN